MTGETAKLEGGLLARYVERLQGMSDYDLAEQLTRVADHAVPVVQAEQARRAQAAVLRWSRVAGVAAIIGAVAAVIAAVR